MKTNAPLFLLVLSLLGGNTMAIDITAESLKEVCSEKAAERPVVKGAGAWLYLPSELAHIAAGKFWGAEAVTVSKATRPENADPLPAILDFKEQLDTLGIELILVPIPAKAMVYPEPLMGKEPATRAPGRLDPLHQVFYAELKKNGVTVVDLLPDFLEERTKVKMYCQTDTHWSGLATVTAAKKIATVLKEMGIAGGTAIPTIAEEKSLEIKGDLARMQNESSPVSETLTLRLIKDVSGEAVKTDVSSPVLLLGDSHTLVFHAGGDMLASGAGLADQLAHELGFAVDLIGVRGSGATPARINLLRKARGKEGYLQGKKAIVWCFTVREFTESSGWSNVPVGK